MEATAYGLRRIKDAIDSAGGKIEEVRVAGGQANSDLWNQIKADVLDTPVVKPKIKECSPLRAAIIAAVSNKLYNSMRIAAESIVSVEKIFKPNPENVEVYDRYYRIHMDLYESLKNLFPRMA